jgi:hypothetical protein
MPEPLSLSSEPLAEGNAPILALLICSARRGYILLEGRCALCTTKYGTTFSEDHDVFVNSVFTSGLRSRNYKLVLFLGMSTGIVN